MQYLTFDSAFFQKNHSVPSLMTKDLMLLNTNYSLVNLLTKMYEITFKIYAQKMGETEYKQNTPV